MIDLTDEQVQRFAGLLHSIPAGRGLLQDWLDENVPGISSKQLAADLLESGRVVRNDGFPPLVLSSAVSAV